MQNFFSLADSSPVLANWMPLSLLLFNRNSTGRQLAFMITPIFVLSCFTPGKIIAFSNFQFKYVTMHFNPFRLICWVQIVAFYNVFINIYVVSEIAQKLPCFLKGFSFKINICCLTKVIRM